MSTLIALTHVFEQRFERHVLLPTHWLRLHPAPHTRASVRAWSLKVDAEPHFLNWVRDPYENHQARLDLPEPVASFRLTMDLLADLKPVNPFNFLVEPYAARYPFEYPEQLLKELNPYLHLPEAGPRLARYLTQMKPEPGYLVKMLGDLTQRVHKSLAILGSAQPGPVDLEAVLARGQGSPWESAWLLTVVFRSLGLAARFTSGYRVLLQTGAIAGSGDVPPPPDSAALHAWSEVFIPGAGWIGLDPSGGIYTHEGYIPLASTPDPLRALPWAEVEPEAGEAPCPRPRPLRVEERIQVRRMLPTPAPDPYSASQWVAIQAITDHVEQRLEAEKLWLAMAPTVSFTAAAPYAAEWTTQALGPWKRGAAEELLAALRQGIAPGGVPIEGQGEWYSGESLPRWRFGCFFRADGQPIWRNPDLLAVANPRGGWYGGNSAVGNQDRGDALALAKALAARLGFGPEALMPAHEDPLHELWRNRTQIQFVPPAEALRDPEQRQALASRLSETLLEPTGYVLPLRWDVATERWTTGSWRFRRGGLYLLPGASPMGYRLPLESLPASEEVAGQDPERCPFDSRPLLSEVYGETTARLTQYVPVATRLEVADPDAPASLIPRTAVCVELRNGRIVLFLPPLTHLEHWLDLMAAIEAAAAELGLPVVLEGYDPPEDFRLRRFSLEPEAGVLKLRLPLAEKAAQLSLYLEAAYEQAAAIGLLAERVSGAGRRQPPGSGSEIVLGGGQPALSPFLSRPNLLPDLIVYWQRHPALSYFFAGRMVGPSGPAPRPDEGRDDALYELGIALSRLPRDGVPGPWVFDRALRHLLADPAGDIHKAEIRIDQLYGPDRYSQRLGRIALASLETAPNARQAMVQGLLVRALIVHLAMHPGARELMNHGPALHDRFMLPGPLFDDLREVLEDLERSGLPLPLEWFEPFLEQRFPVLGVARMGDIRLELRAAHEPWPLLAEEVVAGGVTRFIDSANQRLQVRLSGLTPGHHVLVCNGRRVPLQVGRERGQAVAGVRYKVCHLTSSLHPTVAPVHSLVFDLLDGRTGQVLGGCTWFPARPDLVGAIGAPLAPPHPQVGLPTPLRRLPPPISPPVWSFNGGFLEQGSGARRLTPPMARAPETFTYLLDLSLPAGSG